MDKKKLFTNWEDADQNKAFKRMHRTMDKEFDQATEDFKTIGPTQEKLHTPSRKMRMGRITRRKKRRRR